MQGSGPGFGLQKGANLSDVPSPSAARANLGVGGASLAVTNEWPDPQFQIADGTSLVSGLNDAGTATQAAISVSSYTTGSRTVVCTTANTGNLQVNDLVQFSAAADAALKVTALRVTAIVPNTSFTVIIEYKDGVPSVSAACTAQPVVHGDTTGASGGSVTTNVSKYANGTLWPQIWFNDHATLCNLFVGMARVLVFTKVTSGEEYIYWQRNSEYLPMYSRQSRTIGAAVVVLNGAGANAKCVINNGGSLQYGSTLATANVRTWINANVQIVANPSAYYEGIAFNGPVGSTFVIGELTSAKGTALLDDGSFNTPRGQQILSIGSLSPWINADITFPASFGPDGQTYSFDIDMYQASNGIIGRGVSYMYGLIEGQGNLTSPFSANITQVAGVSAPLNQIQGIPDTTHLREGMLVSGSNISAGTTIAQVVNSSTIQLSQNATGTGAGVTYTFKSYIEGGAIMAFRAQAPNPTTFNPVVRCPYNDPNIASDSPNAAYYGFASGNFYLRNGRMTCYTLQPSLRFKGCSFDLSLGCLYLDY